jgi:hypothetical protein
VFGIRKYFVYGIKLFPKIRILVIRAKLGKGMVENFMRKFMYFSRQNVEIRQVGVKLIAKRQ